jgi:hypothetical protein
MCRPDRHPGGNHQRKAWPVDGAAKDVARACESRLKDEVSPEERAQLWAQLDCAVEMRKKVNAMDQP